jgi:hypothetical protein
MGTVYSQPPNHTIAHKNLIVPKGVHEPQAVDQVAQTDREVDQMVYELYGLTNEETAIVEEAAK